MDRTSPHKEGVYQLMGANKDRGTRAETAVVRLAREMGWPYAERRALTGGKDRGDVTGVIGVTIQIKDVERKSVGKWQQDTLEQSMNDSTKTCLLIVKTKYKNVKQWDTYIPLYQLLYESDTMRTVFSGAWEELPWVRMDLEHAFEWLKEAGY